MKKDFFVNALLIFILLIGLSLLLYPTVSNFWNDRFQSRAIDTYTDRVSALSETDYSQLWNSAAAYNQSLLERPNAYGQTEEQEQLYPQLLNVAENGIMGYMDIPSIDVMLPIYHGTSEAVLQIAIGHLEWTSLPIGGESTHCVVSGHRGLPSARLFTDLDQLAKGDLFLIHVLDQKLTYEVDQIRIVEPHETQDLLIQEGKDLCTLVTCTPYGVNSHRLLVRGHRVENLEETQIVRVTGDAVVVEKLVVAPFLFAPILLVMLLWALMPKRRK